MDPPAEKILAAAGPQNLSERKCGDLSGGQKQRVLYALVARPGEIMYG